MDLRNLFKISALFYINYAFCFNNYSLPNILENNHDLKLLKNTIIKNGGIYTFKGHDNITETITLDQIREIENEVHNLSSTYQRKLTVKNFFLFSREYHYGVKYEILDPLNITSIKNSHFSTRKTYIIIHGFLGYGLEDWILNLTNKLLSKEDCNVISVDWPAGNRWFIPTYTFAVGKVPLVGNDTAFLIQTLMKYKGLLLADIHGIGHSLGAHATGFSAKPFLGRVGKITGLDPAGPFFHDCDSSLRLDKKDAFYVDVIHTNACNDSLYWMDCFGLNEKIGHSDFFPNGGEHQPACTTKRGLKGEIGCDHEMAYFYYISSLDFKIKSTFFLARPCDEWEHFKNGNCSCGKKAQYMGFNVNTEVDGLFYLKTLSHPPYAVEDPSCPSNRGVSVLIISLYLFMITMVCSCVYCTMYVVVTSVRRTCCSNQHEEEESLVSSDTSSIMSSSSSSSSGIIIDEEEDCMRGREDVEQGEERSLQERPYIVNT